VAANNAVIDPTMIIKVNVNSLYSKKNDDLINKNTPAVTIVAACIKAETGVGIYVEILTIILLLS
jgi:hypothetical protein